MKQLLLILSISCLFGSIQPDQPGIQNFTNCRQNRSTGEKICLDLTDNPVLEGTGILEQTPQGQWRIYHYFDENGQNVQCKNDDTTLPDCRRYWYDRTINRLGIYYPVLTQELRNENPYNSANHAAYTKHLAYRALKEKQEKEQQEFETLLETTVVISAILTGTVLTVIYAPIVIPVALANAKAAAVVASAKTAAAGASIKTGLAIAAPIAKTLAPVVLTANYVVQAANNAPEIQLQMAKAAESSRFAHAKKDFEKCMNQHASANRFIVPEICKKEALLLALLEQANIEKK